MTPAALDCHVVGVDRHHVKSFTGEDLNDSGTHRAEAHDPNLGDLARHPDAPPTKKIPPNGRVPLAVSHGESYREGVPRAAGGHCER